MNEYSSYKGSEPKSTGALPCASLLIPGHGGLAHEAATCVPLDTELLRKPRRTFPPTFQKNVG